MTSSFLFVLLCLVASIYAQQTCTSISIISNLRTTWQSGETEFFLYDITAVNNYDVAVTNIVFLIDSLNISQSWNLVQLPGSENATPFTFVATGATSAVTIAPGQSWTGSGYVSEGEAAAVAGLITCTGPSSSSSSASSSSAPSTSESASASSSVAESSSAPASSSDTTECSTQMEIGAQLQDAPAPTWNDTTYQYYEYLFQVSNTGSETASVSNVAVSYDNTFLEVYQTWNMDLSESISYGAYFSVSLGALAPGQTFTQCGVIFRTPLAGLATHHQGHYDFPYSFHTLSTKC